MKFNEKLKKLRKINNLKQKEFSEILGIGYSTLGHYESGRQQPTLSVICSIAQKYPHEILWLLRDDEDSSIIQRNPEINIINNFNNIFIDSEKNKNILPNKNKSTIKDESSDNVIISNILNRNKLLDLLTHPSIYYIDSKIGHMILPYDGGYHEEFFNINPLILNNKNEKKIIPLIEYRDSIEVDNIEVKYFKFSKWVIDLKAINSYSNRLSKLLMPIHETINDLENRLSENKNFDINLILNKIHSDNEEQIDKKDLLEFIQN